MNANIGARGGASVSLTIRYLTVKAGSRTLLDAASADFPAGEVTLIVGPSGAGKSVLLQVLAGLAERSEAGISSTGEIEFRSTVDSEPSRTHRLGVVFQTFAIFDEFSPTANVRFALDHGGRLPAGSPVTAANLLDELNVPRDVASARLSGGQRQRLAIARALAYDPEVILYDEPTSGLDPVTASQVARLIAKTYARHPKTSIIVTHDFESLCPIADRVYLLNPATRSLQEIPREQWPALREHFAEALNSQEIVLREEDFESEATPPTNPSSETNRSSETKPSTEVRRPGRESPKTSVAANLRGAVATCLATTSRVAEEVVLLPYRLLPLWRSARWGCRFVWHYLALVAGPSAWAYMAITGAIIGFVTTYFTFRFLPYAKYTEPLLIDDLLASIGFALYRVLVPILATILIAARSGAALASDVGGKRYGRQTDALWSLGAAPPRYLLTPMLYAMLLGAPCLEAIAYWVASATSLLVFTFSHPAQGPEYWRLHFHRELISAEPFWFAGSGWL
ncbi:MAG: ABC transporter permease, partial [Planctomycetales bacterium]|nr:ABC transporter permease [Planctomycetales bacterium]